MRVEGTVRRACYGGRQNPVLVKIPVNRLILRLNHLPLFSRQKEVAFGVVPLVQVTAQLSNSPCAGIGSEAMCLPTRPRRTSAVPVGTH